MMASNMFQGMGGNIRDRIQSLYQHTVNRVVLCCNPNMLTLTINEYQVGGIHNQVFEAADTYLNTKISPTTVKGGLELSKSEKDKRVNVSVDKRCQPIQDDFEGIKLTWRLIGGTSKRSESANPNSRTKPLQPVPMLRPHVLYPVGHSVISLQDASESVDESPTKFELSFEDKHYQKVVESYIPYILKRAKELKDESKTLKIYGPYITGSQHPSTFQTLAMDHELKKDITDDLDRFVKGRDFYRRVGKAWNRCYLLYGPPSTGKSSLVAAMANYLNFDICDLGLTDVYSSSHLRSVMLGIKSRSIILIDCSAKLQDRSAPYGYQEPYQYGYHEPYQYRPDINMSLSGILDAIDGLWSCCGDEKIIVITTNSQDQIDPTLLLPGRIHKQIHMSYISPQGFRTLASNYLSVDEHHLFGEIDELIQESQTTPAEVAQELMISVDPDVSLNSFVQFLKKKVVEAKLKMLGEQLYPLVEGLEKQHAGKVTGMLLEMDKTEVLHLIESPDALKKRVSEAMDFLRRSSWQRI